MHIAAWVPADQLTKPHRITSAGRAAAVASEIDMRLDLAAPRGVAPIGVKRREPRWAKG
jgi:hypothetical protein